MSASTNDGNGDGARFWAPSLHPTLAYMRAQWAGADSNRRADLLYKGIVWAGNTVLTDTPIAEADTARWLEAGSPPDAMPGRIFLINRVLRRVAAAYSFTRNPKNVAAVCAALPEGIGVAERIVADAIPGIGIAKSRFALASVGAGYGGCWDSRLVAKHRDWLMGVGAPFKKDGKVNFDKKRPAHWTIYRQTEVGRWGHSDPANGQWWEWLGDMDSQDGYSTDHSVLLAM